MTFPGSDDTADNPGFPMSQFLKPFKLHMSRNATMVAQQVIINFHWRNKIVLQMILVILYINYL